MKHYRYLVWLNLRQGHNGTVSIGLNHVPYVGRAGEGKYASKTVLFFSDASEAFTCAAASKSPTVTLTALIRCFLFNPL